jgi:5-methylcytosine-specific restriction endonuclease McrBC GTP-binding regulatory subunit McrB
MPNQPQLDGTTISAPDYSDYNELTELQTALTQYGWVIESHNSDRDGYNYFEVRNNTKVYRLHIYLKKVKWRNRSDDEKAAQFGAAHVLTGYNLTQTDQDKTIVFGIYKTDLFNDTLVCAWNPFEWGTRGNPFNCFIDVHAMAEAYQIGFARDKTKNDRNVYVFRPEFIYYYIANRDQLHHRLLPAAVAAAPAAIIPELARNKIIYGAPGTGKSFELREQANAAGFEDKNTLRVTFHPNYTYQQFVGSYKPVPIYKAQITGDPVLYKSDRVTELNGDFNKEPLIDYAFVEGPLIKQLIFALINPNTPYLLIIEEINRANVAAVFGDVFQLLDRTDAGESEYEIDFSPEAGDYLASFGLKGKKVKLPSNLFIWATMNSADQGVMPMDAAFKRRWSFEYLPLDDKEGVVSGRTIVFQKIVYKWNDFRTAINNRLKSMGIAEDKLLGPFFMNNQELGNDNAVKNKLLLYLRDDVLRHTLTQYL